MDAATRTAVLLGAAALVVPVVWGYAAYAILERVWPRPETSQARSPRKPPQEGGADFLDFQI